MSEVRRSHVLVLPSWYPTAEEPVAGIFFAEQARALQRAGARVAVAFPELCSPRRLGLRALARAHFQVRCSDEEGITTWRIQGWRPPFSARASARAWAALAAHLASLHARRHGRPDVLHAHGALWGGVAALRASAKLSVPYVLTEHTSHFGEGRVPPWERAWARRAFAGAACTIAVSESLGRCLARVGVATLEQVRVIPNLVDTEFFVPPPVPRAAAPFRILAVALLDAVKGIDVLLRAFARGFAGDPCVALEIAGDGPERGRLEALARELGIANRVRFLGRLERVGVREALWRASALVLSSHIETFGIVLVEALSTGLPVIATACGGPEEIVEPALGLLVPPADPAALASGIAALRARLTTFDPTRLRARVAARFGAERIAHRLIELYGECAGGGPKARAGSSRLL